MEVGFNAPVDQKDRYSAVASKEKSRTVTTASLSDFSDAHY